MLTFSRFLIPCVALVACDKPEPAPIPTSATGDDASTSSSTGVDATDAASPTSSTSDASASTEATGGTSTGGYVCDEVGAPCDLAGDAACGAGLLCRPTAPIEAGEPPPPGVCAAACSSEPGPAFQPCPIGWCDDELGMCRDADGLPTGQCPGLPQCAGDQCDDECGGGLSCVLGACALACEVLTDCPDGATTCKVGVCFDGEALLGTCLDDMWSNVSER